MVDGPFEVRRACVGACVCGCVIFVKEYDVRMFR